MKFKDKSEFFEKLSRQKAFILETKVKEGNPGHLEYFPGTYTVKNDKNKPPVAAPFMKQYMKSGYFDSSGASVIDLTSFKLKLYKKLSSSVYHIFMDDMAEIIYAIKQFPQAELILDTSMISQEFLTQPSWNFIEVFFQLLQKNNVKYRVLRLDDYDVIYINNLRLVGYPFDSGIKLDLFFDFFKVLVDDLSVKPFRNVYLSRKKVYDDHERPLPYANLSISDDSRIDSHEKIEKLFSDLGYEIICPEDFENFKEQVNYFYEVKTLASLTSSGLVNAAFMQPGGTIIEVVTPLVVVSPFVTEEMLIDNGFSVTDKNKPGKYTIEIHNFYKNVADLKNHIYIGVPNLERKVEILKNNIKTNDFLFRILNKNE